MPTGSGLPPLDLSLNVYDAHLRKFLQGYVKQTKQSPSELDPVILSAIEEAKRLVSTSPPIASSRLKLKTLEQFARTFMVGVLSQGPKWSALRESISSWRSIFLIGAGLSFSSDLPLSRRLDDLLTFVRASSWDDLRTDPEKCAQFKKEFRRLCMDKQPSPSHRLIVMNFPQHVIEVICLNWDDLLERAAEEAGRTIQVQNEDSPLVPSLRNVWKFHGDVRKIKSDNVKGKGGWVFPDEKGYVFDDFSAYFNNSGMAGHLFTFVIAGYGENERESEIFSRIVAVFQDRPRPTYRIGLDMKKLKEDRYIVGPCDYVFKQVLPERRA